ncbi:MAG: hypothetical protein WCP20_02975 [Desulfuromonadales bacterium]
MIKKIVGCTLLMVFICVSSQELFAGQAGTTDTVFNRRFIQKIKPMMPYDQLVKIIGAEGLKTGEDKLSPTTKVLYHWDGARKSTLDIKVDSGKIIDATVISPKSKKFYLGKNAD